MIMKNNIKVFIAAFLLGSVSCSDSYFDINTPSNTATLEQLGMKDLIAPVIHSTMEGQRSAELTFGNYAQNFVSQGGGAAAQTTASGLWSQIYLYVLPNLKAIKEKAAQENAIHIIGIADVLTAINLGIATDTWDNIPYEFATNGPSENFPSFNTQEEIYKLIFSLLDNAISSLESSDTSGFTLGNSDLIYKGDSQKWLRAAYTIKARFQLRLVTKGVLNPTEVLSTISNGFNSSSDDFDMFYDEKNINPYYSAEVLARNTGNSHNDIASQLVSFMNGDLYPFSSPSLSTDPRLPLYAQNGGANSWKGFVSGSQGVAPDGSAANAQFATDGFYTSIDSPLPYISFAEAMFIKAEASFLANGGDENSLGATEATYSAYLLGIQASMDRYGLSGSDYLSDASISVGAPNLMLHHIMKEKYIHNFLNPETFTDFRRYDFSPKVFKGLQIRLEDAASESEFAGQWFLRAEYPASELSRNEANVLANQKTPVDPVWWDSK